MGGLRRQLARATCRMGDPLALVRVLQDKVDFSDRVNEGNLNT